MRDFRDSNGVHWVVWGTRPWAAGVLDSFRGGWLTFVSPRSRRRLAPIPDGWEEASPARLQMLLASAAEVRPGNSADTPRDATGDVADTRDASAR